MYRSHSRHVKGRARQWISVLTGLPLRGIRHPNRLLEVPSKNNHGCRPDETQYNPKLLSDFGDDQSLDCLLPGRDRAPARINARTREEPMNPAPPVTTYF